MTDGTSRETWLQVVSALTAAARPTIDGDGARQYPDFADFLADALAAVAANLGSVDAVTAGRPGSWEAGLVHDLLIGTVGENPQHLLGHRTEPVVIPLNVDQLVEETQGMPTFSDAERAVPWPGHGDGSEENPLGSGATQEEFDSRNREIDQLRDRYRIAYEHYADVFTREVRRYALTVEGLATETSVGAPVTLRIPVEVQSETDPEGSWNELENPTQWDSDPLVWRIWSHARDTVPLPTLD